MPLGQKCLAYSCELSCEFRKYEEVVCVSVSVLLYASTVYDETYYSASKHVLYGCADVRILDPAAGLSAGKYLKA